MSYSEARCARRGDKIPGLRVTMLGGHYMFAEDDEGHEWYSERPRPGQSSDVWHHSRIVCDKCKVRPLGVPSSQDLYNPNL